MVDKVKAVDLKKRDGTTKSGKDALNNKVVGLYFSAHWCPPCRQFTPILKDFYEELESDDFELVFVSFDRSESDLLAYMDEAHGDWYYVPFGSPAIQEAADELGVSGIPALIIFSPSGKLISKNGRNDVTSKSPALALSGWKQAGQ